MANRVNFTSESDADDRVDHGTVVAGMLAAQTNNGVGIAAVGYQTRLLTVKVGTEA